MAEEPVQKDEFPHHKVYSWATTGIIVGAVAILVIWMLSCPEGNLRTFTGECQTPGQVEALKECTNDIGCYISTAYKYHDEQVCNLISGLDTTYDENSYYWYCRATTVYEESYCDNIGDTEVKKQCMTWFGLNLRQS